MAHTYTNLLVHALFSTKQRRPLLTSEFRPELFAYMAGVLNRLKGKPVLINGPSDHVHMLFVMPAASSLSDLMEKVKANSSKWANEHRRGIPFAWQTGYTAFSVSQSSLQDVKRYIAQQEEHHRRMTFREELLTFLDKHGIQYDPRYVLG